MKRIVFLLGILIVFAHSAGAAIVTKTLKVDWDYAAAEEASITGFRVYDRSGTVVIDNVAPNLRTATASYTFDDAIIQAFHLVAFNAEGQLTTPSNIYTVAPRFKQLPGPGKFTATFR